MELVHLILGELNIEGGEPTTYVFSFPRVMKILKCLIPGCLAVANSAGRLCDHFMYQHFRSRVEVVQEGKEPMTHCDMCGMHIQEFA